jgi:hypothetical protein
MANPFSGLENIGQSYLAGVQLAQQRQARQDALAQRAEEARIRQQYYQDLVDQRAEAARLAAQNRTDVLAAKFGEYLTLNPDNSVNLVESARKLKEAEGQEALAETAGMAEALGTPMGIADEKIRKNKAFQKGLALGMIEKLKNDVQLKRVLTSQGILPVDGTKPLPAGVESMIGGVPQDTELNVLGEISPTKAAPEAAKAAPEVIPKGYQKLDLGGGRVVLMKTPQTKAEKPDRPFTVKVYDEFGKEIEEVKMTAEERAAYMAKPKESPAATNAPAPEVKARWQRDPITGKLVLAK